MSQPGQGFDFNMQVILDTQKAISSVDDIWSKLRELSSRSINLELDINPDFQKAHQELARLEKETEDLAASFKTVEERAKQLNKTVVDNARRMELVWEGAGESLQKAFDSGSVKKMEKAIDDIRKKASATVLTNNAETIGPVIKQLDSILAAHRANNKQAMGGILLEMKRTMQNDEDALKNPRTTPIARKNLQSSKFVMQSIGIDDLIKSVEQGSDDLVHKVNSSKKFLNGILEGGIKAAIDSVAEALTDTMQQKKEMLTPAQQQKLYTSTRTQFQHANEKVMEITLKAAEASWGPVMQKLMGGMAGRAHPAGSAALASIGGAVSGGSAVNLSGSKRALISSISEIIREKNAADKSWPLLNLKASEKALASSIHQAVKAFNRAENKPLVELKGDLNKTPLVLNLDKASLVRQIQEAFNSASGTIKMVEVQKRQRAVKEEVPLEALMANHGLNKIDSPKTATEREHNRIIAQYQKTARKSDAVNIASNPIGALGRFDTGGLVDMANSIKQAVEYIPNDPASLEEKHKKMQEAERMWGVLASDLKLVAETLAKGGAIQDLEHLAMVQTALGQQLGTKVTGYAPGRIASQVNKGIRASENPADEVRQAYMRNIPIFSQDAFSAVSDAPMNVHQERVNSYTQVLERVKQYEKEILGFTHARTQEEQDSARKRVNAAERELEISKDQLNLRLLIGQKGSYSVREFEARFRVNGQGNMYRELAATGNNVNANPLQAYNRTTTVLREQLMPAIEEFNKMLFDMKKELLESARAMEKQGNLAGANAAYRQAGSMTDMSFGELVGHVGGSSAMSPSRAEGIQAAMAKTMQLTAQEEAQLQHIVATEQDHAKVLQFTMHLAEQRLKAHQQEAGVHTRLNGLLDQQRAKMLILSRYDQLKGQRNQDPYGLVRASRGLSNTVGLYAGGMMFGFMLQNSLRQAVEYQKVIKEIQGVLSSKSPAEAGIIDQAIGKTAQKYGASLMETAEAAKTLAQAGYSATQVMRELDMTMVAMRGMGMTIEQMNELQIAIHAVDESISSGSVLEKISRVEASYAVSAQDIAEALKISAPFIKQFAENMRGSQDFVDVTAGMVTTIVEKLRVSGKQAGNALKFTFARLLRPEVLNELQGKYGMKLGSKDGSMLPIDQLFGEVANKYTSMKAQGGKEGVRADQMLATMSGAHRVNYMAALLTDYSKAMRIATESSDAFGTAQERSDIVMDSMGAKIQQVRNGFQLLANKMTEGSLIADGFKLSLEGLSAVLGGVSGGGGGLGSALAILAIGGLGTKATVGGYKMAGTAIKARELGTSYTVLRDLLHERKIAELSTAVGTRTSMAAINGMELTAGVGGGAAAAGGVGRATGALSAGFARLVSFLGPTGTVIAGLIAFVSILGMARRLWNGSSTETDKYRIRMKSDSELRMYDTPQFQQLAATSKELGYGSAYTGFQAMRGALMDPATLARVAKVAGTGDYTAIQSMVGSGQLKNAPQIAEEIMKAVAESPMLSPQAKETLKGFNDEGDRFVFLSRALGEAAFAASYRMQQAIALFHDSVSRQMEDFEGSVAKMDITGTRKNGIQKFFGSISDWWSNTTNLEAKAFGGKGLIVTPSADSNRNLADRALKNAKAAFESNGVSTEFSYALTRQSTLFSEAMYEYIATLSDAQKNAATLGDVMAGAARRIQEDGSVMGYASFAYDAKSPNRYKEITAHGTAMDVLASQLLPSVLQMSGMSGALAGPSGMIPNSGDRPNADVLKSFAAELASKLSSQAQERVGIEARATNKAAYQIIDAAELTKNIERVALVLDEGARGVLFFKDKLTDFVLSLYLGIKQMQAEQRTASFLGTGYNAPQSEFDLFKGFAVQAQMLQANGVADILRKQKEFDSLQLQYSPISAAQLTGDDSQRQQMKDAKARAQMEIDAKQKELEHIRGEYQSTFVRSTESIGSVLPNINPQRGEVLSTLQDAFKDGKIEFTKFVEEVIQLLLGASKDAYDKVTLQKTNIADAQTRVRWAERLGELQRQSIDSEASITAKTTMRDGIEQGILQKKLASLIVEQQNSDMSDATFLSKREELVQEYTLNTLIERRTQLITAQNELQRQSRETLRSTISGTLKSINDLNAFGGMFGPKSGRTEATKAYINGVLKSAYTPLGDRFAENFTETIFKSLSKNSKIMEIFETPETGMKNAVLESGAIVAAAWGNAIYTNGIAVAVALQTAMGVTNVNGQAFGYDRTQLPDDYIPGLNIGKKMSTKNQLLQSGSVLAGQLLGTAAGKGGQYAQTGAGFGSTVGLLAAGGNPIGAIVGGYLGGLLGGQFDKKSETETVINRLEAIEFNTREQITAIEQSTDRLLNPASAAFNLPSNFNVPSYTPQFSGGNSSSVSYQIHMGGISIGSGTSRQEIEHTIEKAVASAIRGGRSDSPRSFRR